MWIIEIEIGRYLANWKNPVYSMTKDNARKFDTRPKAEEALRKLKSESRYQFRVAAVKEV
jgi:hypothetical protein